MKGKVVLVTGGARGIGRAIALALANAGARVVVFDRDAVEPTPSYARCLRGDVALESDLLALFADIRQNEGRLDVAVNCAGVQLIRPLIETTADDFDSVISINLRGTFLVGREAARMMLSQQPIGGRIINLASELAYCGRAKYSAYCASKGAILSLTRSWARELAPHILVNAVAPGPTDTAMVSAESMTEQELRDEVAAVPLG